MPRNIICLKCNGKKDYRAKMCHSCRMKFNPPNKGKGRGWHWTQGYIKVQVPDHPFADGYGYIFEHRLVVEEHLGFYLNPMYLIHHINEIRYDNRWENLEITERNRHVKEHSTGRFKGQSWKIIDNRRVWI